jgi:hypothetical protein
VRGAGGPHGRPIEHPSTFPVYEAAAGPTGESRSYTMKLVIRPPSARHRPRTRTASTSRLALLPKVVAVAEAIRPTPTRARESNRDIKPSNVQSSGSSGETVVMRLGGGQGARTRTSRRAPAIGPRSRRSSPATATSRHAGLVSWRRVAGRRANPRRRVAPGRRLRLLLGALALLRPLRRRAGTEANTQPARPPVNHARRARDGGGRHHTAPDYRRRARQPARAALRRRPDVPRELTPSSARAYGARIRGRARNPTAKSSPDDQSGPDRPPRARRIN